MGGHAYFYFVPYQSDINAALQELREREFLAGRYNPAVPFPSENGDQATGAKHPSIRAALAASDMDGTRSILDLDRVSTLPEDGAVSPVDDSILIDLYGTAQPTRAMIEEDDGFLEEIERGQGFYVVTYQGGIADQIYFGGCSYD